MQCELCQVYGSGHEAEPILTSRSGMYVILVAQDSIYASYCVHLSELGALNLIMYLPAKLLFPPCYLNLAEEADAVVLVKAQSGKQWSQTELFA